MLRSEFENLTGIYPPENLFEVIEEFYMKSELSKQEFCCHYKHNVNQVAKKIQKEADKRASQTAYLCGKALGEMRLENAKLKKEKVLDEVKKLKDSDVTYIYAESKDNREPNISIYGNPAILLACTGRIIEICAMQAKRSPAEIIKAFAEIYGK
ncbi:MAG: hypothetical protein K2H93_07695 [Oscillospiraceae bacterium]|nr:hypothetical protein [Oscillospiraceae bacterium]